jgi:hypothetical protein
VIALCKDGAIRLSELLGITTVAGKGDKQRTVRFTYDSAGAGRVLAGTSQAPPCAVVGAVAWRAGRADDGQRRLPDDRAAQPGGRVEVNPHNFRYTFSHNWLDSGGAEGDPMEFNG